MGPRLPVRVAVANDYEIVVEGTAGILRRFPDEIVVVDRLVIGEQLDAPVDVALYDTYGRRGIADAALKELAASPQVRRVAVFSLDLDEALIEAGRREGATGFISKALTAREIVDAVIDVAAGRQVVATPVTPAPAPAHDELDWPGKDVGLTERESQVLVLVAEGLTNREVAEAMVLSTETVKSYLSQVFNKLGLRNRVEATTFAHRTGAFHRFQPTERLLDGQITTPVREPSGR